MQFIESIPFSWNKIKTWFDVLDKKNPASDAKVRLTVAVDGGKMSVTISEQNENATLGVKLKNNASTEA